MVALEGQYRAEVGMSDGETGVDLNGRPSEMMRAFEGGGTIFVQWVEPSNQVGIREGDIGPSIERIEGNGVLKEPPRLIKGSDVERRPHRGVDSRGAHEEIVCLPDRRRLQQGALQLGLVDIGHQDRNDRSRNLVLDGEDVIQLAVITLSPAMSAGERIDQLRADADAITSTTNTAFEDVAHAELAADLSDV